MRLVLEIGGYIYVMLNKNTNIGEVVKALSDAVVCDRNYIDGKYVYIPKENSLVGAILIQDTVETSNA